LHIRRLIEVALHRLVQSTPGLDKVATALASNALEEVLIRVAGERYWGVAQPMDARIATILHFMTENFSQPITVDELAEMASLSASRLAHLFKEQVGDSIIQTLLKFRLRQAAHLLETTSLDVRTVAAEVGFQSMFYFSRQFKAHYELSPSAYRKQRDE
jgi:AraC family transcriptional regulator of arabinose operon